jgi:hypothetical protein
VLALILPARSWAQATAGGEVHVNTFTTGQQLQPTIARTSDGQFVVVWITGYGFQVAGQRFDRAGSPVGTEFLVNSGPFPARPGVAFQPGGGFVVVWTQYSDGSANGIRGQRFAADASKLGSEFQVNATTTGSQDNASIAVSGSGNFVVAWNSPQDGAYNGIMAQRFDAQGARLGAEFVVNTYTTYSQLNPRVASDVAGNFVIAWNSQNDGSSGSVNAQRYAASGAPLGGEFQVNSYTTAAQGGGSPAYAPDGTLVIAFGSQRNDQGDIFVRRFDAAGNALGGEFQVNTYTTGTQSYPRVALDALGNFVVAWNDLGGDGDGVGVRARRLLASGTPRGADFLVNTYTTGNEVASLFGSPVASDAYGNMVVTWQRPDGSDPAEVFLQRYGGLYPSGLQVDPGGNQVWEPGETASLRPSWFNANGAAQTFGGTLASITGPAGATYGITDGTASYGTVANNTSGSCTDCYSVSVSNPTSRPVQHWDASAVESITPDALGEVKRWSLHIGKSFTDVPNTNGFYRFVETLFHKGVTGGCGGTSYCPSTVTTRDQMSVFVLVAKEGAGYTPQGCGAPVFADVPASNPFCRFIEELARRGVVSGCGNGNYCPTSPVTRDAMSVFALRTLDPALNPPACVAGTEMFADVPASNGFCRWIEELARRGVVSGCGNGNYCPTSAMTREQMGVFISATFGLTLYGL